jgi:hypothetical protein
MSPQLRCFLAIAASLLTYLCAALMGLAVDYVEIGYGLHPALAGTLIVLAAATAALAVDRALTR